jgi:hypothetical protein
MKMLLVFLPVICLAALAWHRYSAGLPPFQERMRFSASLSRQRARLGQWCGLSCIALGIALHIIAAITFHVDFPIRGMDVPLTTLITATCLVMVYLCGMFSLWCASNGWFDTIIRFRHGHGVF